MKTKLTQFLDKHLSSEFFSSREILKMLFPLILDSLFIHGIMMLTTSMISSSGEASVAAVSMMSPVSTLVLCLINAIAAGGTVVVAHSKGRGEVEQIREAAGHTLTITTLVAVVCCTFFIVFAAPTVHLLYGNAEPEVISKSITYLIGTSVSTIIYAIYGGIFAIFRGMGETKICLHLTVMINASYFIFSFIFINLLKLDIMGTIIAFILARLLGAVFSVYHLFLRKKRLVHLNMRHLIHFDKRIIQGMLKISIPFASEQIFFYGGGILVQKYMVVLGTQNIAANAIANSLFALVYATPLAVGNLATTVIGQCVGAGRKDLARKYCMKLVHLGTALVVLSILFFIPLMPLLLRFYHPDPAVQPEIIKLIWMAMIPMPLFHSLSNVMPYVLRSAGDAVYPSVVSLVTMWVIRVGAGYISAIPMGFGLEGIWVCMVLEWVVRAVFFYGRYRGPKWLSKHTVEA